jgi:hypothetical protein
VIGFSFPSTAVLPPKINIKAINVIRPVIVHYAYDKKVDTFLNL